MTELEQLETRVRKEERRRKKQEKKKLRTAFLLLGVLLAAAGVWWFLTEQRSAKPPTGPETACFSVLDVGQGSALLITAGGESMLVDGGPGAASSKTVAYLKKQGISRLKYLLVTHYDADHIYGAIGAMEAIGADTVLAPDYVSSSTAYEKFMKHVRESGTQLTFPSAGESFSLGSCSFSILGPVRAEHEKDNDRSLILRFTDGKRALLCCGDAESEAEAELLEASRGTRRLESDVYIVNHHGSAGSCSEAFLKAVRPRYAVISCGKGNEYGHPAGSTLNRLKKQDCALYRTDLQGDILFRFREDGIEWDQEPTDDWTPGQR